MHTVPSWIKGGFSRNFYARTHVNFTRLNTIEAMYGRSRVHENVEPCSTFTHVDFRAYARKNYETVDIHRHT